MSAPDSRSPGPGGPAPGTAVKPARKITVALKHERDSLAPPRVSAKGKGELADKILALAKQHGVPVREDADLLELLAACDLGEEIPVELYAAVAELLAYLYRLNGELAAR
jgi:flagellar biosynthesis protein